MTSSPSTTQNSWFGNNTSEPVHYGLNDIEGSHPRFYIQKKKRVSAEVSARATRAEFGDGGFKEFYAESHPTGKLTDTAKKHFEKKQTDEQIWKSSIRNFEAPVYEDRAKGKKPLPPPETKEYHRPEKSHVEPKSEFATKPIFFFFKPNS